MRAQAEADPVLLLERFPPPVILDEIQYPPRLLPAVKAQIDRARSAKGRFVLTGSQHFPLMQGATESLAGRAAVTTLLSMSLRESFGHSDEHLSWDQALAGSRSPADPAELLESLYRGGYPEPALSHAMDVRQWHASYVQTYLERDVRALRALADVGDFQRFLVALAARSGGLLNFEDLARDLGVTAKTVRAWVTVLEASGQVLVLKPYHASLGKRLVKRPKVYFLDTGTLAYLLGVTRSDQLFTGMAAGAIFESAVLGQLHRLMLHRGELPRLYFWRTAAGHEVDFLLDTGSRLVPIEAKLTATPSPRDAVAVEAFQRLMGKRAGHGMVVCLCRERFPLARTVDAVPLGAF